MAKMLKFDLQSGKLAKWFVSRELADKAAAVQILVFEWVNDER
jgi:hypothetical protein